MSDELVDRLRRWAIGAEERGQENLSDGLRAAADEIEDLRFQLEGTRGELENALSRERTLLREQEDCRIGADNLHAEIERLRAERDEARRMACGSESRLHFEYGNIDARFGPATLAAERGWDCYKEAE